MRPNQSSDVLPGKSFPLGATVYPEGVNFSVFSKSSTALELLLFENSHSQAPERVIALDPKTNRTFHYWHVYVPGLKQGQLYAFRAHGPFDPQNGYRFEAEKILIDPYGKAIEVPEGYSRAAASEAGDNASTGMKSVVADLSGYDWEVNCRSIPHFHRRSSMNACRWFYTPPKFWR